MQWLRRPFGLALEHRHWWVSNPVAYWTNVVVVVVVLHVSTPVGSR